MPFDYAQRYMQHVVSKVHCIKILDLSIKNMNSPKNITNKKTFGAMVGVLASRMLNVIGVKNFFFGSESQEYSFVVLPCFVFFCYIISLHIHAF